MRNIELKVSVNNFDELTQKLVAFDAERQGVLRQRDTYFNVECGRLKLREIDGIEFELIYYERPNKSESKISTYEIVKLDAESAQKIKSILTKSLGIKIVVEKERNLWMYENTRIHLDVVQGLGYFLELETVVDTTSQTDATQEHLRIIESLNLSQYSKQSRSYSDMFM